MKDKNSGRQMTRRDFLKLAGGAAAAAAGIYLLDAYSPWLAYPGQADIPTQGTMMNTNNRYLQFVHAASLAASGHNTQPWKFELRDAEIRIHPDYTRRLPVVDPEDRELWISLGCALENLLIAASAAGFPGQVTYPQDEDFISVRFGEGNPEGDALFAAIPLRQNTRADYDALPLPQEELAKLAALPLEPGIGLSFWGKEDFNLLAGYVRQGNLIQYADQAFKDELVKWIRFTKKEALSSRDGLFSRCSGNPEVPRMIGRMFVNGMKPEAQAEADEKKMLSSSGAVIISSASDGKADLVRSGQVYERLALAMTASGIKSAFLNQPIETPALRGDFQNAMGLGIMLPQLLVRFGRAAEMPRSLRRPVEEIAFEN